MDLIQFFASRSASETRKCGDSLKLSFVFALASGLHDECRETKVLAVGEIVNSRSRRSALKLNVADLRESE